MQGNPSAALPAGSRPYTAQAKQKPYDAPTWVVDNQGNTYMVDEWGVRINTKISKDAGEDLMATAQNMGDGSYQSGGEMDQSVGNWGGKEYRPSHSPEEIAQHTQFATRPVLVGKLMASQSQGGWH